MPNKRARRDLAGASLALLALGACVPRAAPPAPLPAPAPAPRPAPPPVSAAPGPATVDWETGPATPGDWTYMPSASSPAAVFRSTQAGFSIRCQQGRVIWLGISGAQGDALVIRTSFGMRRLPAERVHLNEMVAQLPTSEVLLDQMAFSRGRFMISVEGGPSLVVPAWPEIARVIEDCRGQ